MTTRKKTQSALRATLKQEDAAVAERLPAVASTAATKPAAREAAVKKPVAPKVTAPKPTAPKVTAPKATAPKPQATKPASSRRSSAPSAGPAAPAVAVADKVVLAPAAPRVVSSPARAPKKAKAGKVVRDAFSIPKSEHAELKSLRNVLARAGRPATKSEMLRAGLRLLSQRSVSELLAVLDALPVIAKGKAKGKK